MKYLLMILIFSTSFLSIDVFSQQCNLPTTFPTTYQYLKVQNEKIASCFAPVVHQMTNGVSNGAIPFPPFITTVPLLNALKGRADLITSVNYDDTDNAGDNWENLELYISDLPGDHPELLPVIYYSVSWTDNSWIISYDFYHPRDYATRICCPDNHENDLEGAIFVVDRLTHNIIGAASISHEKIIYKSFNTPTTPDVFIDDGSHAVEIDIGPFCIMDVRNPCDGCKSFSDPHIIYFPSSNGTPSLNLTELNTFDGNFVSGLTGTGGYALEDIFGTHPSSLTNQRLNEFVFTEDDKFFSEVIGPSECQDKGFASAPWGWDQLKYSHAEIRLLECLANSGVSGGIGSDLFSLDFIPPSQNSDFQSCLLSNSSEEILFNEYDPPNLCAESSPGVSINNIVVTCPNEYFDISTLITTTVPEGTRLVFTRESNPTGEPKDLESTFITESGTFYAYYYGKFYDCWSPGAVINVEIEGCCPEPDIIVEGLRYTEDFENFGADVYVKDGGTLIIKGKSSENDHHRVTVSQDKEIIVENGGTLIFEKGSSIRTCHKASSWGGIKVMSGGYVFSNGESQPTYKAKISGSSSYAIDAEGGSFISLTGIELKNCQYGLRLDGEANLDRYDHVNIDTIAFNGLEILGDSFGAINAFDFTTSTGTNNSIVNVGWNGIYAENVLIDIQDFTIGLCNRGVYFQNVPIGTITGSDIIDNKTGISLLRSSGIEISNNQIIGQGDDKNVNGIYANRSFGIDINNNVISTLSDCIYSKSSSLNVSTNNITLETNNTSNWVDNAISSIVSNDIYTNNHIDIYGGDTGIEMLFSDESQITNNDFDFFVPNIRGIELRTGMKYEINQNFITNAGGFFAQRALNIENSNENSILCNHLQAVEEAVFVRDNSMVQDFTANLMRGLTSLRMREEIGPHEDKGNSFYKEDASLEGFLIAEGFLIEQIEENRFIVNDDNDAQVPTPEPIELLNPDSDNPAANCQNFPIGPNWNGLTPPGIICAMVDRIDAIQQSDPNRYTINMIHFYRYYLVNFPVSEWPECLAVKWNSEELCGIRELVLALQSFNQAISSYYSSSLHNYISTQSGEGGAANNLSQLNNQYQQTIDNNLLEAENTLQSIVCDDEVVTTWTEVMIIFIKYIKDQNLTNYDLNLIGQVGQLCSQEYGDPVNWSETIYSDLTETNLPIATNCNQEEQNLYVEIPNDEVVVSPNPTNGLFNIEIPFEFTSAEYRLTDNVGRLITRGEFDSSNTLRFDISAEQTGIFFLHLIVDKEREISKKIVNIK